MTVVLDAMKRLAERSAQVRAGALNEEGGVPSPCVSVCKMDADRVFCSGCLRTLDELRAWSKLNNADKRQVWERIEARLP